MLRILPLCGFLCFSSGRSGITALWSLCSYVRLLVRLCGDLCTSRLWSHVLRLPALILPRRIHGALLCTAARWCLPVGTGSIRLLRCPRSELDGAFFFSSWLVSGTLIHTFDLSSIPINLGFEEFFPEWFLRQDSETYSRHITDCLFHSFSHVFCCRIGIDRWYI